MTQILLYQSDHGIVLATDSRGVAFDSEGENATHHIQVQKFFPISPHAIAVTGGAGYGILLCQRFQRYARQARLDDLEEIIEVAPGFFRSEAVSFHQKSTLIHSELHRFYVVIAGYIEHETEKPFRSLFLASEGPADLPHAVKTSNVLTIPRQIGIEHRLALLSPSVASLDEVELLFKSFLLKLAHSDDEIGPPFHFFRIASDGIRIRSLQSGHETDSVPE